MHADAAELTGTFCAPLADLSHLASIGILLHKIQKTRSARGEWSPILLTE